MADRLFVTLKAAIWKDGKLLLQRENSKGREVLKLPGGRINEGETVNQGLRREVDEEIGVNLKSISENPVKIWTGVGSSSGTGYMALLYEAELENESFILNKASDDTEDIIEVRYFTLEEIETGPVHRDTPKIIEYFKQKQGL